MRWPACITAILLCALPGYPPAYAQESAEQYIPIGESPGVSGVMSIIGKIDRVNYSRHMMVVQTADATRTIRTGDDTRFYIDLSDARRTNRVGDFDDCTIGRRVEVKLGDDGKAEWVKIDAS